PRRRRPGGIQCGHADQPAVDPASWGGTPVRSAHGDRIDENLRRPVAAQAEPATANLHEARRASTEHLQPAADADTNLREPTNPSWLAGHFRDFRPFAATQKL